MKDVLKLCGAVEAVATRKDKTVRVTIGSQELTPDTAAELFRLQNAFVYVLVKEEDFGREELEAVESMEAEFADDKRKTSSQRLRAVLFLLWKQDDRGFERFEAFYLHMMDKVIQHYKSKLE